MKKLKLVLSTILLCVTPLITHAEITKTLPIIEQQAQVAGFYQHQVGNTQITALLDGTNFMSPTLFKDISQDKVHEILKKYHADQAKGIQTSINAFLVNTGDSLILIDSGTTDCFGAHLGSVLKNLKSAGYQPEQVNTILLTHLHPDHSCGVSKDGVANYPNATIYVSEDEANYWLNSKQLRKIPKDKQEGYAGTVEKIKAALAPYQTKNQFKTFKLGDKINGFDVISTAGHTPGHFSYKLKTTDEDIVFIGDIVHSHTVQFDRPEIAIDYDIDPQKAVETRLKQFPILARSGVTIAAPHLPFPGIGHIYSANEKSYQWIPVHFKD
ncbi:MULTISPECIES: MBL fold metallo-hydrolase [unclassified Acinetobacter]|uniref:MBL fold metallo-hydrolase n=1 Tax=unclassified Acinetobacter TaxID=196816 RepID=UPI00257747B3|nr:MULTISPECIES: MBL fold metallo-hydrolase [unclassified Acinetobacter]MDM1762825.1 MBL fold metallo-hydrolase [Acinetobacter sp. 226-1]MDM1766304.1 MBL fold metallo-hydrolase [Acinetobacter sp. 226-4]